MRWTGVRAVVVGGLVALLAFGCDSVGPLSAGLAKKPEKKKADAGVAMTDGGTGDGGTDGLSADGGGGCDATGPSDAGVTADAGPNAPPTVNAGEDVVTTEGASVALTAMASDPDGDPLAYDWTFRLEPSAFPASCGFTGAHDVAAVTFRCDDDVVAVVTVTVSDGHGAPVADDVRVEFRNVAGASQFLRPQDGLVIKRDTPLDAAILIQEPNLADIDDCTLFRDDHGDVTRVVKPTPTGDPSLQTCVWPASTFLTQLTGMRHVVAHVGERDAMVPDVASNIVVYAADPREVASGEGTIPVCTTGNASLEFAVRYDTADATRPHGFVRYQDPKANIDFSTQALDWFVVSRVRPSQPPDTIAVSGHAQNGGRDCSLLLFARGPKSFEFATGSHFGEARLRLVCGTDVYDTNPSSILDVDDSPMTPFREGEVHIDIPQDPPEEKTICGDPANEGADCRSSGMRNVASAVCHAGHCVLTCIQAPSEGEVAADCDGFVENGCEIDIMGDPANCGFCGNFCAAECIQKRCHEE
jgi:hypothetical protein